MTILLDTNIVIDVLTKREGYSESLNVLRVCELKKATGVISAITVTDAMYILRKHLDPSLVRDAVSTLTSILDVADVSKADIMCALESGISDFEDAVQMFCAKRIKADFIITRNLKDFAKSPVPAISPTQVIKLLID